MGETSAASKTRAERRGVERLKAKDTFVFPSPDILYLGKESYYEEKN